MGTTKGNGGVCLKAQDPAKGMLQAGPQQQARSFHVFCRLLDPLWVLWVGVVAQWHSLLELRCSGLAQAPDPVGLSISLDYILFRQQLANNSIIKMLFVLIPRPSQPRDRERGGSSGCW